MRRLGVSFGSVSSAPSVASANMASFSCFGVSVFGTPGTGATASTSCGGGRNVDAQLGSDACTSAYISANDGAEKGDTSDGGTRSGATVGLKVAEGYNERRYASIPAVWGEAMEVPERVETASSLPM